MIARLTITAVAAAIVGLLSPPLVAQDGASYPIVPVGYADSATSCTDSVDGTTCAAGVDCTSLAPEMRSPAWLGRHHHPGCMCPLCQPRPSWGSFDALLWWGKGRTVPALLTTGPQNAQPDDAGVLDQVGTRVLFPTGRVGHEMAAGARADFGFWFNECETLGMGARVWGVDGAKEGLFLPSPTGDPILARPYYNLLLDAEDALLISYPGELRGSATLNTDSSMLGAEGYLRTNMFFGRGYHLDLIGGYHFIRLDDEVDIIGNSVVTSTSTPVPVGTTIDVADYFDAKNEFHGGEVGVVGEARHGRWTFSGLAKLSVGNMRQRVEINGVTSVANPGFEPTVTRGGLLALPTNIGQYTRDELALIPEFNLSVAYRLRDWLHLTMGYNAIYVSNVVLSGDQIDRVVNASQLSGGTLIGPAAPLFTWHDTEYWMHGLSLGATVTY